MRPSDNGLTWQTEILSFSNVIFVGHELNRNDLFIAEPNRSHHATSLYIKDSISKNKPCLFKLH